jgi:hypothetical protein
MFYLPLHPIIPHKYPHYTPFWSTCPDLVKNFKLDVMLSGASFRSLYLSTRSPQSTPYGGTKGTLRVDKCFATQLEVRYNVLPVLALCQAFDGPLIMAIGLGR